jgi:hypothetical protein
VATHIFIGPSGRGLGDLLDDDRIVVHPPIRDGDLTRLDLGPGDVVGIVDGLFYSVPAIKHGEILLALDRGARVIGGGSMGALRAADLDVCGMEGVGTVYDWLRRGVIDADHEVALLHGDASTGYRPQTLALVTLRGCLGALVDRATLRPADADIIVATVGATWFGDRTQRAIEQAAQAGGLDDLQTGELMAQLAHGPDVKALDAAAVVRRSLELAGQGVGDHTGAAARRGPPGHWTRERAFDGASTPALRRALALQAIQLYHPDVPDMLTVVVRGLLAGEWGVADDVPALAAAFGTRTGLNEVGAKHRRAWLWPEVGGSREEDLVRLAVVSYRTAPALPAWEALERHVAQGCDLDRLGGKLDALLAAGPAPGSTLPQVLGRLGRLWGCGPDASALRRMAYSRGWRDLAELYHVARQMVGADAERRVRDLVAQSVPARAHPAVA